MFAVKGKRKPVDRVVFSPDGGRIAWGSYGGLAYVYDFAAGGKPVQLPVPIESSILTFTPDGRRLVAWSENARRIVCLDSATGTTVWTSALDRPEAVATSLAVDADGQTLWATVFDGFDRSGGAEYRTGVRRFDLADGTARESGPGWGGNHGMPTFVAVTADGATLVVAGNLSIHTYECGANLRPGPSRFIAGGVGTPSVSADGRRLTFSNELQAEVVAVPSLETLLRIACDDPRYAVGGRVGSSALTPDGSRVLTANNGKFVALTDVASGTIVGSWAWDAGKLRSAAVASDGLRAAVGSDTGRVVVWDLDP